MIKLNFLIIFDLILNVNLQQEKNYNDVFSEKYCEINFLWFLYDHKSLEIFTALHADPKCTQNGLESCVSVAIYGYPVGHIALSDYHRFNSETLRKTTVIKDYKDNFLLIPYRFDKSNKENSGESNQPILIAKDVSVGYICFFGINDKENSIGLDPFRNIDNNVNSEKKDTLMRVESQYQAQSRNHKSKLDLKDINEIYTLNTSEKSDTFIILLRLKDFNKNRIKRDVKVINRAKIKLAPIESDLRGFLKPEFEYDSKRYIGQELKSELVQETTQKENLEPSLDEKPESDPDIKPDPDLNLDEKLNLDPDQRPQPDPDEKLKNNSDEKPDPYPDKKPEPDEKLELDSNKKPEPDPEEKPDVNADEKSDPDLDESSRPNPNENPEPDTEEKPDPDPDEKPEPDSKEKLDNDPEKKLELDPEKKLEPDPEKKPEPGSKEMTEPETNEKPEPDPDDIPRPEFDEKPDADPDENAVHDPGEKLDPDRNEKLEPDLYLKLDYNSVEKPDPDPNREPDTDLHQKSNPSYQFWNPFTILLVTVATSVTILVVIVGAYHFGKIRGRVNMPILINDIEPQIIIPRIRNVRQNPFYSNYV